MMIIHHSPYETPLYGCPSQHILRKFFLFGPCCRHWWEGTRNRWTSGIRHCLHSAEGWLRRYIQVLLLKFSDCSRQDFFSSSSVRSVTSSTSMNSKDIPFALIYSQSEKFLANFWQPIQLVSAIRFIWNSHLYYPKKNHRVNNLFLKPRSVCNIGDPLKIF